MWIKNEKGIPSATLTFATLAVFIVLAKFIISGLTVSASDKFNVDFGKLDAALVGAILAPTLGAYVARRYTNKKFAPTDTDNATNDEENTDDINKQA